MSPRTRKQTGADRKRLARDAITNLIQLDIELKRRVTMEDPRTYGLPDLLRDRRSDETDEEFQEWRDRELKKFIEAKLTFSKNATRHKILLAVPMLRFVSDLFYRRVSQAILWKPRGGGGSLCAAILIWFFMVYHKLSITNAAGSQDQAKVIYDYTKGFWDCFPDLSKALLACEPLQSETKFMNGVVLKLISASEKQARGKHNPIFIGDESCQAAENTDRMLMAAMQGAMSESTSIIILLSTFHHPIGLFQEVWDFAEERGFTRYKWNIFDVMEKCTAGMETATPEDPLALHYCRTQCPLTTEETLFDENDNAIGTQPKWCNGKARNSDGFVPRKNILVAEKMNRGTNVFDIEYACSRPNWMRPIYPPEMVERTYTKPPWPPPGSKILEKSVGIDWGLEGQTCLVLSALIEIHRPVSAEENVARRLMDMPPIFKAVGVLETAFMTGKLTTEAIKILWQWVEEYGQDKFFVYPDASHPFNNLEVTNCGFDVRPVQFSKWKDYGIGNCLKYISTPKKLFIRSDHIAFLEQIKRYRQDHLGKAIKKDDHGPDAWMSYLDSRTKVMTRSGWIPVGKLTVGTEVLTHAGRFRPIIRYEPSLYTKGKQVVVNFAGRSHSVNAHRVTLEHPFQLDDGSWIEAENLKPGMKVRCLAARCLGCGAKIPWNRKACDECVGSVRNARWRNPGKREKLESERKSKALVVEYTTGIRNATTNAKKATEIRAKRIRSNPQEREKVREHLRSILPLVNTPEKRERQARLMKNLHARRGFFDHLRTPGGRERCRRRAIARIIADQLIPFNCRLERFTDIERAMFDSFQRAGFSPAHNPRIGRWFIDVALPELKIAVECDGGNWHNSEKAKIRDAKKDAYLEKNGWKVFRFSGEKIKEDADGCRDEVLRVAANHEGLYEFTSVEVASVKIVPMKKFRTAYHFEVEEDKSYVARGIVSHNCSMLHFMFEERFPSEFANLEEEVEVQQPLTAEQRMMLKVQQAMATASMAASGVAAPLMDGVAVPGSAGAASPSGIDPGVQSVVQGIKSRVRRDGQVFSL